MTLSTVGKFNAILAKIAQIFTQNKFKGLSENRPNFLIISLLDRGNRDLVGAPQKRHKIVKDKMGKLEMSRTTTTFKMGRSKTC